MQVEEGVLCEQVEHVIEKTDAGIDSAVFLRQD